MNISVTLFSQTSDEKLTFRVMDAYEAMFKGQQHSWVEHEAEGKTTGSMHMWHDNEEKSQIHLDKQVKSALVLGWIKEKKREQLGLF